MVDKKDDNTSNNEDNPTPEEEAELSPGADGSLEPEESASTENASGEDVSAEDISGEDVTGEDVSGEVVSADDTAEDDTAEDDTAEDDSAEDDSAEDDSAEDDSAETIAAPATTEAETVVTYDSAGHGTSEHNVQGVAAIFDHPKHLMAAAELTRDSDYEAFDAFSPFPIHGMDEAMGLGRSWIPWVTTAAALVGFISANMLQFGMMTFDWPLIIGGKPFAPWPSFVPIMFELSVLIGGVTTVIVMLWAAGCFKKPTIIDPRITDDRFALWISADDENFELNEAVDFLEKMNPLEVRKVVKDA